MTEFENLFLEYRGFIFKYLMKLCRDASLAEELTQETFFRAYINYSGLRDAKRAPAWLCQIAKNTYFTWYKQQKTLQPLEAEGVWEAGSTSLESVEDFMLKKELSTTAYLALNELEQPYKEVFLLFVFGELSLKEISEAFGKSESWARVTFYRARGKLAERMREANEM